MEELEQELENLNLILSDLERKQKEKEHIKEKITEELELLNQEIIKIHQCIKEKREIKKAWEEEVRIHYDDSNIFGKWNKDFVSFAALSSSLFHPSIINARIIPVNNDGVPVEQLGESKWTRKND